MTYNNHNKIITWMIFVLIVIAALLFSRTNINVKAEDNSTNVTNTTNTTMTGIISTNLEIWDSGSSSNISVNQTAWFYANYTYENGTIEGSCTIFSNMMNYNSGLYYYNSTFQNPGNYSYDIFCSKEGFENRTEILVIEILPIIEIITNTTNTTNISNDKDNDGYTNITDCNDNNPNINPGMQEILYNGIDDDCNSNTIDYLIFEMTTDKQTYSPGETVKITINAKNNSDTYLTINTPSNVSYVYIFSNASYPLTKNYTLTSLSGVYSIDAVNYYGNYTNVKTIDFNVQNTMNIEIETNVSAAYERESIHFKAVITGAIGNVNMIWRMDDNNERYASEFDYNYTSGREYNVVLIATDQGGNQITKTKKILIYKQYFMKVKAIDNSTGLIIPNATVRVDGISKDVNSTGEVEFKVTNKTYELKVSAEDYYSYLEDIKLNNSLIFTVKLVQKPEDVPPAITIIYPSNNTKIATPEFRFRFSDEGEAECKLFISEEGDWWEDVNSSTGLQPNTDYRFIAALDNRTYYWKIQCIDEDDNVAYSPEYYISISSDGAEQAAVLQEDNPDTTYSVIQNIYDVIPDFDTYSPDEQKIVEYLKMDTIIKDAKRKLEMANRDIFNLKYQPDSESVINTRNEIYSRIDQIKDETPTSVSSKKKVEFVKYVDDAEIETLFNEYIGLKEIQLSNAEKKRLIEQNRILQKKATISTIAYTVDITYISGRSEEITLIVRNIDFGSASQDMMYVEFIPKEITESSENIVFVTQPDKILKEDPVFEIKLSSLTEMVYYIKDSVSLDSIPKIKPLILTTKSDQSSSSGLTGFAVFDSFGFSESNKKVFIIELIVVFVLLGVYLFYYFRSPHHESDIIIEKKIKPVVMQDLSQINSYEAQQEYQESDPHKTGYIKLVLQKAKDNLKNNNLKDAALKYYEIKFLYELLEEKDKAALFNEIMDLSDQLTFLNIRKMIDEAIIDMAMNKHEDSLETYEEIQVEFEKLSEVYREQIYPRCCELALHLQMRENEIKKENSIAQ